MFGNFADVLEPIQVKAFRRFFGIILHIQKFSNNSIIFELQYENFINIYL